MHDMIDEEARGFMEMCTKIAQNQIQKQKQANAQPPVQHDNVYTNNCWGNMDYSPLAPTDTLNVKVSPAMAQALAGSVAAFAVAPTASSVALPPATAIVHDLTAGQPSFSLSITGHHGETFGHLDFP